MVSWRWNWGVVVRNGIARNSITSAKSRRHSASVNRITLDKLDRYILGIYCFDFACACHEVARNIHTARCQRWQDVEQSRPRKKRDRPKRLLLHIISVVYFGLTVTSFKLSTTMVSSRNFHARFYPALFAACFLRFHDSVISQRELL